MTSTTSNQQPVTTPGRMSGTTVVGGQWARHLPDAVIEANTAALAVIGIRPNVLKASAGSGAVLQISNMDQRSDWLGFVDDVREVLRPENSLRRRTRRPYYAPPLTVDDRGPQQRAALEQALVSALHARTSQEFGAALQEVMQATGCTQGDIVRHDGRTKQKWLSKSTVSRMVNGTTISRHREQVEAFIRACGGVATYVETWGYAWSQARTAIRADRSTPANHDGSLVDADIVDDTSTAPACSTRLVPRPV